MELPAPFHLGVDALLRRAVRGGQAAGLLRQPCALLCALRSGAGEVPLRPQRRRPRGGHQLVQLRFQVGAPERLAVRPVLGTCSRL